MHLTRTIAEFVANVRYEDLPPEVVAKAKDCILDCIGVTIAGTSHPIKEPLLHYLETVGGGADATVIGHRRKSTITGAALVNGVFGHVLDFDDTNQIFIGHATVVILPAILALAEKFGLSGKDMLTAFAVGTEVQWRMGEMLVDAGDHYAKGWHSTGTVGAFGAAAACSRLLGLDVEATTRALGIVASEAGGFQAQIGTHCKPFHAGRSNENGIRAAVLARSGFTSAADALEAKVGYLKLVADRYDLSKLDNFGSPWGLVEPSFGRGMNLKAHPICASGLGAVEGIQELLSESPIDVDQIESIQCGVRPHSLNILLYHKPKTSLQAKFSAEYWIAAALTYGRLGLPEITDAAVNNPALQRLIPKIAVKPDPEITTDKARVKTQIRMKDGTTRSAEYYPAKGSAENPMSRADLLAKFMECATWEGGIGEAAAKAASQIMLDLETMDNPARLAGLLSGSGTGT